MAYCPECRVEYDQSSRECIDCHVPLLSGSVPEPAVGVNNSEVEQQLDLVVARRFTGRGGRIDAQLARKILESEGIRCVLPGESASEIYPAMELVQLMVFKNDAARAAEILHSYLDDPPPTSPEDESIPE